MDILQETVSKFYTNYRVINERQFFELIKRIGLLIEAGEDFTIIRRYNGTEVVYNFTIIEELKER